MFCSSHNLRASPNSISVSIWLMKMSTICEACLGFNDALIMDGSAGMCADDDDGRSGDEKLLQEELVDEH